MLQKRQLSCVIAAVLTIIIGLILLISSVVYIQETRKLTDVWKELHSISIFSLIISIFLILITICFIYVVSRQFPALISVFSALLAITAFLSAICIIIVLPSQINITANTRNSTIEVFSNYSEASNISSTKSLVDYIQQTFECCGVNKPEDWINQYLDGISTPDSCCKNLVSGCGRKSLNNRERIFTHGCNPPFTSFFENRYQLIIGLNLFVIIFAVLTTVFGFLFERFIRNQYQLM